MFLVALTAFVGFTTAIFSRARTCGSSSEHGRLTPARLRLYHSMYQLFNFTMLLALLTNNLGILWVAMEAATLTTVLLVSLYRTPASLEAAWKYFILCGVGIAQALFGTILLYFAAEKVLGADGGALLWTELDAVKGQLEPTVLSLAFVFLLVGYGTKVGLVPLHNWLPDAHAEGPTPVSAVLSGLLLNVALYAVVRCKVLVDGALQTARRGQPDDGLRAAVGRRRGVSPVAAEGHQAPVRLFVDRAHGDHHVRVRHGRPDRQLRRPAAHDRALAHQVGDLLRRRPRRAEGRHAGDRRHPRARSRRARLIGWGLALGTLAILGMPPFGVFASEFLILTTAMREQPWATPFLLLALGIAFAAVFSKVQPMVFGETDRGRLPHRPAMMPVFVHLALVLMLGLWIPPLLADWYRQAAQLIG